MIGVISDYLETVPQRICVRFKQEAQEMLIDGINDAETKFVVVTNEETCNSYKIQLSWSKVLKSKNDIIDEKIISIPIVHNV